MTDLEMTRLCAEAMGLIHEVVSDSAYEDPTEYQWVSIPDGTYKPLEDDAQAMALVKKIFLDIVTRWNGEGLAYWRVQGTVSGWEITKNKDLNRAIVECVAKMRASQSGDEQP